MFTQKPWYGQKSKRKWTALKDLHEMRVEVLIILYVGHWPCLWMFFLAKLIGLGKGLHGKLPFLRLVLLSMVLLLPLYSGLKSQSYLSLLHFYLDLFFICFTSLNAHNYNLCLSSYNFTPYVINCPSKPGFTLY